MASPADDTDERASRYAAQRSVRIEYRLGFGRDGSVYSTDQATAIKAYLRPDPYRRELGCYQRLQAHGVSEIAGHNVPELCGWHDELCVIEIGIVKPPYLLDFADGYLDRPPEFPEGVLESWYDERRELFGPRWPHVETVLTLLRRRYGIHLLDIHPGNITFVDPPAA